ncbi:MAG: response regulator [Lachnospiraceae bacterium]|nr:response regulator [Lachnospiraceae bacterium]
MKKKERPLAVALFLLLALCGGVWYFVNGVSGHLWRSSVRTIIESTHQGANALNLQFEAGFDMLEGIWGSILGSGDPEAVMELYREIEPDVRLYLYDDEPGQDPTVNELLEKNVQERGILVSHINGITGENVFNLFLRVSLSNGLPACLVKEYRTNEIVDQFTLTFYDNIGVSYLVDRKGDIMVWPAHKNGSQTAANLFDLISGQENDPQAVEDFRESVKARRTGWAKFTCSGTGQVLCYEPLRADSDWLLVSIVPEYVITEETNRILKKAMIFSGTAVGIVLIIAFVLYGGKMRENEAYTREIQAALNTADAANRAKGRFLMDMSHDIRTPLNAIIGMTAIAQQNIEDRSRLEDCLRKIKASGTQLLSMVNDVLDMSQIEQGKVILKEEGFLLPALIDEIAGFMSFKAEEAGLTVELVPVHVKNEMVAGDPLRLQQVLFNIVSNAIKYTPAGGRVTLELTQPGEAENGCAVYCFCCTDTGIGMEPEFLSRVFLPFERARNTTASKIAGTGVGLAITKSLVGLMGGEISVESEPGRGSVFTVKLPLRVREKEAVRGEKETSAQEAKAQELPNYADKRILLVEDNELNMEIMAELLGIMDVKIEKACDGREAVRLIHENPHNYYDLVFMDIQMPVMDGYEATRRIRRMEQEKGRNIPIFAVSANALAEDVKNAREAGMNGHIAKPVDLHAIEKTLRQCFG